MRPNRRERGSRLRKNTAITIKPTPAVVMLSSER